MPAYACCLGVIITRPLLLEKGPHLDEILYSHHPKIAPNSWKIKGIGSICGILLDAAS